MGGELTVKDITWQEMPLRVLHAGHRMIGPALGQVEKRNKWYDCDTTGNGGWVRYWLGQSRDGSSWDTVGSGQVRS